MSRLCLGTFFTAINVCVEENSFKQREDFANVFVLIDPNYDPSPDLVSKFVRGVRNPSKAFISTVNKYEPDQYSELCFCMDDISNKINEQSEMLLTNTITKIAKNDETIPDNEIVDLVNGTKKKDMPGKYRDLSSFLTGVFLYVIKYVKNDKMNEYVKQINRLFIAEFINQNQKKAQETTIADPLTEAEELQARRFILTHEKEEMLVPLCQIVYAFNPSHNYKRNMFTEYNLLSGAVRKCILDQVDASKMIDIDELRWQDGLSLFCEDLRKYGLSSERYIHMFTQYFPASLKYASHTISGYDEYSLKRILVSKVLLSLPSAGRCNLDSYIDDYLYINDNDIDTEATMPMDYLCETKALRSCPEEAVMYWLCRFIIDACNNLSFRITGKPMHVDCYDRDAETIEDLFFSAIYALHRHYHFHNNDCMGMDINI